MAKNAEKIPSLLNYTRSIVPSEGIFWAINEEGEREPIIVSEKTVLGTISNYSGVYKKGEQISEDKIEKAQQAGGNNIQRVDSCSLPAECDTFEFEFSIKFLPNSIKPECCNNESFAKALEKIAAAYKEKNGYNHLAEMYLARICNGSFLWRNRYGINRKVILHASFDRDLRPEEIEITDDKKPFLNENLKKRLQPWIIKIASALSGNEPFFLIRVKAMVTIGLNQEVYPSQEFVENETKSKTLFSINKLIDDKTLALAGMHSQKIGNAIRTIDIWYPNSNEDAPLAVEPFSVNKRIGRTVRLPNNAKSDFYSYLSKKEELLETLEAAKTTQEITSDTHYFMAVLIRGGVFSGESDSDKN